MKQVQTRKKYNIENLVLIVAGKTDTKTRVIKNEIAALLGVSYGRVSQIANSTTADNYDMGYNDVIKLNAYFTDKLGERVSIENVEKKQGSLAV